MNTLLKITLMIILTVILWAILFYIGDSWLSDPLVILLGDLTPTDVAYWSLVLSLLTASTWTYYMTKNNKSDPWKSEAGEEGSHYSNYCKKVDNLVVRVNHHQDIIVNTQSNIRDLKTKYDITHKRQHYFHIKLNEIISRLKSTFPDTLGDLELNKKDSSNSVTYFKTYNKLTRVNHHEKKKFLTSLQTYQPWKVDDNPPINSKVIMITSLVEKPTDCKGIIYGIYDSLNVIRIKYSILHCKLLSDLHIPYTILDDKDLYININNINVNVELYHRPRIEPFTVHTHEPISFVGKEKSDDEPLLAEHFHLMSEMDITSRRAIEEFEQQLELGYSIIHANDYDQLVFKDNASVYIEFKDTPVGLNKYSHEYKLLNGPSISHLTRENENYYVFERIFVEELDVKGHILWISSMHIMPKPNSKAASYTSKNEPDEEMDHQQ